MDRDVGGWGGTGGEGGDVCSGLLFNEDLIKPAEAAPRPPQVH